ncbi:hypothetical protein LAZ40_01520 [Cereibacter sphaeroides]|uniref:hypothetical protein n=1 Tax=Cereibacter sphaeroides TaxID=1063 RepID=UPI001F3BEFB7|nr:hypothetical protein [Cereibacter sphaeroides]MCE6957739.1 hypothetical protein [Cereibacter sphaeroides]MCE6971635.1 hypothetical protein [Cereibacter sphaeroides]
MKFLSKKAAQAAMRRTKEQRGLTAATEAYACRFCGGWHWGHAKGTGRDRAGDLLDRIDRALKTDTEKRAARSQTTVDG